MRWLLVLSLVVLSSSAFAACGPDAAPAQAVAQGYTCETFRWGSGDTAAEIDSGKTYAAPCANAGISPCGGLKLYWANTNGGVGQDHNTVIGDYSVQAVTGKIITQTSVPADHGKFVLNTCGGAGTNYTTGTFFQNGFYAELVGEWDATGNPSVQAGFYSLDLPWYASGFPASCPSAQCFEIDDPDAFALNQTVTYWGAGSSQSQPGSGSPVVPSTVETGTHKWGVLVTPTATTWWVNDVANGAVTFQTPFITPLGLYQSKQCWGIESVSQFANTLDSLKVWQAGQAAPAGGSGRRLKH